MSPLITSIQQKTGSPGHGSSGGEQIKGLRICLSQAVPREVASSHPVICGHQGEPLGLRGCCYNAGVTGEQTGIPDGNAVTPRNGQWSN